MATSTLALCTSQPPLSAQQRDDALGNDVTEEYSSACRRSWSEFADVVVSVNSHRERMLGIEQLVPRVIYVDEDMLATTGKPLGGLDDLITESLRLETSHIALINADVILEPNEAKKVARQLAKSEFMAEIRRDTTGVSSRDGADYAHGFDFFVFERSDATHLLGTDFAIGVPWWDHFVPVALILSGASLVGSGTGLSFSLLHQNRWSTDTWHSFGQHFLREILRRLQFRHLRQPRFRRYAILLLMAGFVLFLTGESESARAVRRRKRWLGRVSTANLRLIADSRTRYD
jgi:hypothetical protein